MTEATQHACMCTYITVIKDVLLWCLIMMIAIIMFSYYYYNNKLSKHNLLNQQVYSKILPCT